VNRGFINLAQSRPKVNFSNLKVKEKDREYTGTRARALAREDGKVVVVEKGHLYLGRTVKDVGPKDLSSAEEVAGSAR